MIEPNYNFENEISDQYGIAAIDFRKLANLLLIKYIVITQKEYDIIMWQACNLSGASLIRIELLKNLYTLVAKEVNNENLSLQHKLNL